MKTNGKEFLTSTQFGNKLRRKNKENPFNPNEWYDFALPNNFNAWRKSRELTNYTIAKMLKEYGFSFSVQYVTAIDEEKNGPSNEFMYALKIVFGVSIDAMFFEFPN